MNRYAGLDLVRAFAILWVVLFHGYWNGYGTPSVALAKYGWMGVDLFFALSGYLIGSQLLKIYAEGNVPSFKDFYRRRAFRILPAYAVVLALYFAFPAFNDAKGLQPLGQFLTFTQNLKYDAAHSRGFSHSWSLCVEEHFYLLFPIIAWYLFKNPSWKKTVGVCSVLFFSGMILRAYIWLNVAYPGIPWNAQTQGTPLWMEQIYYPTYTRLDGIMLGVCIAAVRCFRPKIWQWLVDNAGLLFIAGVACVACYITILTPPYSFIGSVFGYPLIAVGLALVVAAAASGRGIAAVRIPGVQLVALMAYSIYLIHKQAFHLVKNYFPTLVAGPGYQQFIVYAAAGIGSGVVLYYCVELPFLKLRDRFDRKAEVQPASPAPQPVVASV